MNHLAVFQGSSNTGSPDKYICVSRFWNGRGYSASDRFSIQSHWRIASPSVGFYPPPFSRWMMRLRVTLRKSGAYITQISASEDKLYLRCFQEHRHAEWAALSLNTSLMKEMSDCNLARLFHRQRTDTHTHSLPSRSHLKTLADGGVFVLPEVFQP